MARVPTVDEPRQQLNALPGNRQQIATPDGAFGATQGRQLQQVGQTLGRVADVAMKFQEEAMKFQEEADKAAVLDFNNKAELIEQDLTAGEGGYTKATPTGVFGADADKTVPFTQRFDSQYQQKLKELRDGLASPRQQAQADALIARRAAAFRGRVQAYEGKLIDDYNVEIGTTAIKVGQDAVHGAYNDPVKIEQALASIVAGVQQVGVGKRLGKEALQVAALEAQSKALSGAVDRALDDGRHDLATNLLLQYGNRMTEVDKKALVKPVAEAARVSRAQDISDQMVVQYDNEADAVAAVRKAHGGADEEFFVKAVQQRFAEKAEAMKVAQGKMADDAWSYVARGQRPPQSIFRRLDGKSQYAINNALEAKARGRDDAVKTDWNRYVDLREMARNDPAEFLRLDLRKEAPYLAKGEREGLLDLKDKLVKGGEKANEVVSMEQQITAGMNMLQLGSNAERKGQFQSAVYAEITAEAKRLGREPNYDERQKVIDRMMLKEDAPWYKSTRSYYQVRGTEDAADFEVRIPDSERANITAALKRANRPVNEAEVMRLFRLKHGLP